MTFITTYIGNIISDAFLFVSITSSVSFTLKIMDQYLLLLNAFLSSHKLLYKGNRLILPNSLLKDSLGK